MADEDLLQRIGVYSSIAQGLLWEIVRESVMMNLGQGFLGKGAIGFLCRMRVIGSADWEG